MKECHGMKNFKIRVFLFCMAVVLVCQMMFTGEASAAAKIIIHNTFNREIYIAFLYLDTSSKRWTTEGWWGVDANASKTLNLNKADASKVLYHARAGNQNYVDKSTLDREKIRRWVSDDLFEYDVTEKPWKAKNPHISLFYSARYSDSSKAFVVRIDEQPEG
jgi:uncharacterized membrane protein